MGLSGNQQGCYKFLSLRTGMSETCYSWTQLPLPDTVIAQVTKLGQGQAEELTFTDHKGHPVVDVPLPEVDSITGVDGDQNLDPIDYENIDDIDLEAEIVEVLEKSCWVDCRVKSIQATKSLLV
jgi:hypothetical protein